MALARTDVNIWPSAADHGTGSFSTGSFTPPANSLLIIRVMWMGNSLGGDLGIPTISGGGLTYTRAAALDNRFDASPPADWNTKGVTFTAPVGGSPSSMTITVDDDNNQNIYGWCVQVVAFTGYDAATPLAGHITSGHNTNIANGAHTLTLSATPTADDVTLFWLDLDCVDTNANPSLAANWTEIHDQGVVTGGSLIVCCRRENSTSTTVSVTDVFTGADVNFFKGGMAAVIVKASAAQPATAQGQYGWGTYGGGNYGPNFGASDITAPIVNLTSPSTFKMSDESTKDAYSYAFSANEAGQAWKIKVVSNAADVHTAGTQVESGGSFTSGQEISGSITYAELVAAGMGAEGVKILKFFAQDTAGNWST